MASLNLLTAVSNFVGNLGSRLTSAAKQTETDTLSQSLMGQSRAARVEPITLVESDLVDNERIEDVLSICVNLYSAIYLQAVALSGTTVSGTQIIKTLNKINPARGGEDLAYAFENIEEPIVSGVEDALLREGEDFIGLPDIREQLALENLDGFLKNRVDTKARTYHDNEASASRAKKPTNGIKVRGEFKDSPELAVGKLLNVDLKVEGGEYSVPVSVRLATTRVAKTSLINALQHRFSSGESSLERKVKWKTGSINSLVDLITAGDLVREHYKNLIADKDGVYGKLTPGRSDSILKAMWTNETTVAQASNVLILSRDTVSRVEALTGGKFDSLLYRQRMLRTTGIMLLVIIDPLHDDVTFYLESLQQGQVLSGRSLARASKGDGPDVTEILKALATGQSGFLR